jgi:NADH:ubiquinone oxidoreductase subunit K
MTGLVLTGAEVAIGLALAIIMHKKKNTIGTKKMKKLRS